MKDSEPYKVEKQGPEFLRPSRKKQELVNKFMLQGRSDITVSRTLDLLVIDSG